MVERPMLQNCCRHNSMVFVAWWESEEVLAKVSQNDGECGWKAHLEQLATSANGGWRIL
jgi:hypothetical protein